MTLGVPKHGQRRGDALRQCAGAKERHEHLGAELDSVALLDFRRKRSDVLAIRLSPRDARHFRRKGQMWMATGGDPSEGLGESIVVDEASSGQGGQPAPVLTGEGALQVGCRFAVPRLAQRPRARRVQGAGVRPTGDERFQCVAKYGPQLARVWRKGTNHPRQARFRGGFAP